MINLLERMALAHTQVTRLHAELKRVAAEGKPLSAKVEIKLTPRKVATEDSAANQFQVSVSMQCTGRETAGSDDNPLFTIDLELQAVYRQFAGEPVDLETFTASHASLTRQLYPLIHHQLQPILKQFGLDQVRLPYDLVSQPEARPQPVQLH